jgi:hypothetical protein
MRDEDSIVPSFATVLQYGRGCAIRGIKNIDEAEDEALSAPSVKILLKIEDQRPAPGITILILL